MGRGRPSKKRPRVRADDDGEPKPEPPVLLPVGAEVEVRTDDPGFAGAFFEATVLAHDDAAGGYRIRYETLETDAGGGTPLEEHAPAANVRPRPPPPPEPEKTEFALHDAVEALHNDGWWPGVVSAVPVPAPAEGGCRYEVTFPTSREVIEFDAADLRPRRVFKAGQWIPFADVGDHVEVSGSAKKFGEFWNPATVLKVIGGTDFLVQYRHAGKDRELVTEIINSQYIRPARPLVHMDSKYRFPPSSNVEVFREGSWQPGVIMKAFGDGLSKKYVVKLKNHEMGMVDVDYMDKLTVESTQLRPHFDWDGRGWVRRITKKPAKRGPLLSSQKKLTCTALVPCSDNEETRVTSGSYLDVNLNDADIVPGSVSSLLSVRNDSDEIKHQLCSYLEKMVKPQHAVLALGSQLAPPLLLPTTGFSHLRNDASVSLSTHVVKSSSQMIAMPSGLQIGKAHASLFGQFGQLRSLPQGPVLGMQSHNPYFSSAVRSKKTVTDQKRPSTNESSYLMTHHQNSRAEPFVETDVSRKRKECVYSQATGENLEIRKKRMVGKATEGANDNAVISEEVTKQNIGDDGPQNDVIPVSGPGSEINTVSCTDLAIVAETQDASTVNPFPDTSSLLSGDMIITKMSSNEFAVNEQHEASQEVCSSVMVECQMPSVDMGNSTEAEFGTSESTLSQLPSVDVSVTTEVEHHISLTVPEEFVGNRTYNSRFHLLQRSQVVRETIMADQPSDSLAVESFPFVKTSPVWAQIEAMEVFTKVTRQPNFQQFQQYAPELREGMALGLMICFTNLAKSIKRLSIKDETAVFEEKMEALTFLEGEGFDVSVLRSHVAALLHIKNRRIELQHAMKILEEKISQKETDDRQVSTQISVLNAALHQHEAYTHLIRGIMKSAITQKLNNATEISRLRMEATELGQSYASAEQSFSSAATPW
ncbi:hypothetical protein U9M48_041567 [Paspalum notatum var. saurae]|uniref:Agenet domain-containing protein n=1 Tax=Paspalum notatum var. saurae TaxID=547442 RepID=A0AAQ3XDG9_PASNO